MRKIDTAILHVAIRSYHQNRSNLTEQMISVLIFIISLQKYNNFCRNVQTTFVLGIIKQTDCILFPHLHVSTFY